MRRIIVTVAAVATMVVTAGVASADAPANPHCWGVVSSQRAVALGDIGEHASSQATPRMGLGNFARFLYDLGLTSGPHISDAATVAAALDGIDATFCP